MLLSFGRGLSTVADWLIANLETVSLHVALCCVEAIFRGIKGLLQHSSVWLLHFLISSGLTNAIATGFIFSS